MDESASMQSGTASTLSQGPDQLLTQLWRQRKQPNVKQFLATAGELSPAQVVAVLAVDQRERWKIGDRIEAEYYLHEYPAVQEAELAVELVYGEFLLRQEFGEAPASGDYLRRFPQYAARLQQQFDEQRTIGPKRSTRSASHSSEPPAVPGYQVLGELDRGGFGIVYKAWQLRLKRLVALKMIRDAAPDPEQRDRFRIEAEAVAQLQHPNIVQIHDVGEYEGRPFFAMEYVEGGSLADKLAGTPMAARPHLAAQLVQTVARAVHAAHQRGVIHRDLKPANILLAHCDLTHGVKLDNSPDDSGHYEPKITDFGLAKKLDGSGGQTQSGARLGTPSYMAPEQAEGRIKDIGPATDVYALGAILYELLIGRPPFKAPTAWETIQQVVTEEPVAPSRLQSKVPRDLETICLQCLKKSPDRRYASALELADDLRRFLTGEPIRARPVSYVERLWRWCGRNPMVAALAASAALLLVAGTGISTYFGLQAHRRAQEALWEKDRADEKAAEAQSEVRNRRRMFDLLIAMLKAPDPINILNGPHFTLQTHRLRSLLDDFKDQPALQAELMDQIGTVCRSLGRYPQAKNLLEDALRIRRTLLGNEHPDVANSMHSLAWLLHDQGDYEGAESLYQQALKIRQAHGDELLAATTKFHLAWLYTEKQDYEQAESLFGDAIATRQRLLGNEDQDVAVARVGLAALHFDRRRYMEAWVQFTSAMKAFRNKQGADVIVQWFDCLLSAGLARHLGNHTQAADNLQKCLEITQRLLGNEHRYVGLVLNELAVTLDLAGKPNEAERRWRECLEIARKTVGIAHPRARIGVANLAQLLARRGRAPEGVLLYEELLAARRQRYGSLHSLIAEALVELAMYLAPQPGSGNKYQARLLLERASSILVHNAGGSTKVPVQLHLYWDDGAAEPAHIYETAFSPDGRRYVASGDYGTARVYEVLTGECLQEMDHHGGWIQSAAFAPDGKQILTAGTDGTLRLWPVSADHTSSLPIVAASTAGYAALSLGAAPWTAATSLVAGSSKTVRELRRFDSLASPIHCVAIRPDGKLALACGEDGVIWLWEMSTGKSVSALKGPVGVCYGAFSPDGQQVLSCHHDGTLRLWNVATAQVECQFKGHEGQVWGGSFLPGGKHLFTYGQDKTVRFWDVSRGEEVRQLRLDDLAGDRSVAIRPDGKWLVSLHQDRTLRMRDLANGKEVRFELRYCFRGNGGTPRGVSISPDGYYAACGSHRGLVYLFRLPD